jgi:hypothetical protein
MRIESLRNGLAAIIDSAIPARYKIHHPLKQVDSAKGRGSPPMITIPNMAPDGDRTSTIIAENIMEINKPAAKLSGFNPSMPASFMPHLGAGRNVAAAKATAPTTMIDKEPCAKLNFPVDKNWERKVNIGAKTNVINTLYTVSALLKDLSI